MNAIPHDFAPYEMASAATLAEQPVSIEETPKSSPDWDVIFSHLESRLGALRVNRYSWWMYWASLAQFILPRRYRFLVTPNLWSKGNPINQTIVDMTGTLAMNICSAGFVEGVMPSTRPWFKLGIGLPGRELDAEAKAWLEDTEQRAYTVLAQSNFYTAIAQCGQDITTFGTTPAIMYEDPEDVIRLYVPCAGEYYLAAGARFSVDTLYREFTLTVSEIVEMFQLENCPQQVRGLWETGGASLENEFTIAHAIEPNFPLAGRKGRGSSTDVVKGGFTYRELYWLKGVKTERELSRRGFNERPFAAARWSTVSNDAYGRGPGMDALGDIKQLQLETARKLEAIEKQVRPPMVADVRMKNEPSSILPGHITYTTTDGGGKRPGFWPAFEVQPNLAGMVQDLKEIQERINRAFLVDVFMAITNMEGVQPRNDLEIVERRAEKLQRLGPVIGLWKSEFAGPMIQRLLSIMQRRTLLKPLPESLKGVPLKIDYMDMVTMAQLGAETASMERTFQVAGNLSAAAKAAGVADPIRVLNLDKSMRIYGEKIKFPTEGMYTDQEVAEHDQARAKNIQEQKMFAATSAGVQAAKTLSETQLGAGQNALQRIISGPQ